MSYFEIRHATSNAHIAADLAQHLQTRQHLGKTIVVCDKPIILMSIVRKHWFKQARALQKERAGTINAEKILRLTHLITHMHRMSFVAKTPEQQPHAHAYFITTEQARSLLMPINTYSLYLTVLVDRQWLAPLLAQLPMDTLAVDYARQFAADSPFGLRPKAALEAQVFEERETLTTFLAQHHISPDMLSDTRSFGRGPLDDALDILLGISHHFLQLASNLQHAFELAQPLAFPSSEQHQYDVLILLAHRVQALNPVLMQSRFTYNLADDETFFLHDQSKDAALAGDIFATAARFHQAAGRSRLARALLFAAG